MTSIYPYGQLKRTTKAKQYLGNRIVSTELGQFSENDEPRRRDYSKVEVHGYIPDKTIKSPSDFTLIFISIIVTVVLGIMFFF